MDIAAILSKLKKPAIVKIKTPLIIQMENVECGAAALTSVMAYYKKIVPLEETRVACGVSRNGVNSHNITIAAQQYGFDTEIYSMEVEDLYTIAPPYIIHWEFNHFVTVEGYTKQYFYINDPAIGYRKISLADFDKSFTGIMIEIRPGKNFQPSGKNPSLLKSVLSRLSGARSAIIFLVLLGITMVIPGLLLPVYTKIFVDEILVAKLHSWIAPLLIGMGITAIVRGILEAFRVNCMLMLETKIAVNTASRFFLHILYLPISFFQQRSAGDIVNRIGLNDQIASLVAKNISESIVSMIMIVFCFILMLHYSLILTLITITIALLNFSIMRFAAKMREDDSSVFVTIVGKFYGVAMNGLSIIESLKASGRESDFFSKWAGHQAQYINTTQKIAKNEMIIHTIIDLTNSIGAILVLSIGSLFIINGDLTIGTLVAFQSLMMSFLRPINHIVNTAGSIHDLHGNISKLNDLECYPHDPVFTKNDPQSTAVKNIEQKKLSGSLKLENISFGYSRLDPPLIKNFNLDLEPGQRIAIVGSSGCGKSTIIKLIMRLYQPWDGTIYADGTLITAYSRETLLHSISMASQEINFFSGTIHENLTMWSPEVLEHDIKQAAKDACIHEDICAREGDYNSKIDESGKNFSGGQRQRLEIARALVLSPRILLMDEGTSALDPLTEIIIDNNIRRRGCSMIIVAHRLSTIRDCDEIIVMDNGEIIERGNHDQLIKAKGTYFDLVKTM